MDYLVHTYQIIAIGFGLLLILSLLLGELFEWVGDVFESGVELIENALELIPGIDNLDFIGGGTGSDSGTERFGLSQAILAFFAMFGVAGWVFVAAIGPLILVSLFFATGMGVLSGLLVFVGITFLFKEGTSVSSHDNYVGLTGTVTVPIGQTSKGSILVTTKMGSETLTALSYYNDEIPKNTIVTIAVIQGGVAYVTVASEKQSLSQKGG